MSEKSVRDELSVITGAEINIVDAVVFQGSVTFSQLPTVDVSELPPLVTKPSVLNRPVLITTNTSTVNVTNFIDGHDGQTIKVLGDGNTVLVNGTYIITNTGLDKLLASNIVYTFTLINSKWYEAE